MRESNIELARVVSMIAVLACHFVCHGFFPETGMSLDSVPSGVNGVVMFLTVFLMFGTNLFILISGYFGINLSWKKIVGLWSLCSTYNLLELLVNGGISVSSIVHCFLISCTKQWFFQAYFWLLISSYFLNAALKHLSDIHLRLVVLMGLFLVCVSDWFLTNPNSGGGSCIQLIYMYIVGAFIRRDSIIKKISRHAPWIYLTSCLMCIVFLFLYTTRGTGMAFQHNSPFSIVSSVAVFLIFVNLKINSTVVNRVATATPAVLLISDSVLSAQIYRIVYRCCQSLSFGSVGILVGIIVVLFVIGVFTEYIRLLIIGPLNQKLSSYLSQKMPILS